MRRRRKNKSWLVCASSVWHRWLLGNEANKQHIHNDSAKQKLNEIAVVGTRHHHQMTLNGTWSRQTHTIFIIDSKSSHRPKRHVEYLQPQAPSYVLLLFRFYLLLFVFTKSLVTLRPNRTMNDFAKTTTQIKGTTSISFRIQFFSSLLLLLFNSIIDKWSMGICQLTYALARFATANSKNNNEMNSTQ